jgi:hypothetical protein
MTQKEPYKMPTQNGLNFYRSGVKHSDVHALDGSSPNCLNQAYTVDELLVSVATKERAKGALNAARSLIFLV